MDSNNVDIVLIRMDKIGDLILTLPLDQHPALRGQKVHWFVTSGLQFLAEQALPARAVSGFARRFSVREFSRMLTWFRVHRPRSVVLLHAPWWVSCACWWAGVPERIGRRSQWHSFLFLNLGIRQKRSKADRHESDFNFDLVELGFTRLGLRASENLARDKKTYLQLRPAEDEAVLRTWKLKKGHYRVVHPGMAGSALNWPPERYLELTLQLSAEAPVVITGTKMDQKYLAPLEALKTNPHVVWLAEQIGLAELLTVLKNARSVIAPSTGVIHLAASLNTPVVGLYSPRTVEHPRRWGPKGPFVQVLCPREDLPGSMNTITVTEVLDAVRDVEARSGL